MNRKQSVVILLNTFARQKIINYTRAAAFISSLNSDFNIFVIAAHKVGRIRSALEDTGSADGNSNQKRLHGIVLAGSFKSRQEFVAIVKASLGDAIAEDEPMHIYVGGDDTCLHIGADVWRTLVSNSIGSDIDKEVVIDSDRSSISYSLEKGAAELSGPGVSTTFIATSFGMRELMSAIQQAFKNTNGSDNIMLRRTALNLSSIDDLESFTVFGDALVGFNGDAERLLVSKDSSGHVFSENDVLKVYGDCEIGITAKNNISRYFLVRDSYAQALYQFAVSRGYQSELSSSERSSLMINYLDNMAQNKNFNGNSLPAEDLYSLVNSHIESNRHVSALSMLDIDSILESKDSYKILPPQVLVGSTNVRWGYTLFSCLVAVKTHPRDTGKPLLVVVDKKVKEIYELYRELVNYGWTEDQNDVYALSLLSPPDNVEFVPTSLADFLIVDDYWSFEKESIDAFILEVSNLRAQHRNPKWVGVASNQNSELLDMEADISIMCTTHSEREFIHDLCRKFASYVKANKKSVIWPGNERNNMRSFYSAVLGAKKLIGISCPHLIDVATKDGRIPACDKSVLVNNIYERMWGLLSGAKAHCFMPFGVGGILEICSRLIVDQEIGSLNARLAVFFDSGFSLKQNSEKTLLSSLKREFLYDFELVNDKGCQRLISGERNYFFSNSYEAYVGLISDFLDNNDVFARRANAKKGMDQLLSLS